MTRTNTQTKTTTPTLVSDCTCKPKAAPSGKMWQKVGKTPKAKAPTQPPEAVFTRYDFHKLPGVSLIVPDGTAPVELIRIASAVAEEMSLLTMRKVVGQLIESHEADMAFTDKLFGQMSQSAQREAVMALHDANEAERADMAKCGPEPDETRYTKPVSASKAESIGHPSRSQIPTIDEIINIHTSVEDFLHRWMKDNAPAEIFNLFKNADTLWCAELGYFEEGTLTPKGFDVRDIVGAACAATARLCDLDPDFEVDDE